MQILSSKRDLFLSIERCDVHHFIERVVCVDLLVLDFHLHTVFIGYVEGGTVSLSVLHSSLRISESCIDLIPEDVLASEMHVVRITLDRKSVPILRSN